MKNIYNKDTISLLVSNTINSVNTTKNTKKLLKLKPSASEAPKEIGNNKTNSTSKIKNKIPTTNWRKLWRCANLRGFTSKPQLNGLWNAYESGSPKTKVTFQIRNART